jgi:predicted component of type VI protein secretion system
MTSVVAVVAAFDEDTSTWLAIGKAEAEDGDHAEVIALVETEAKERLLRRLGRRRYRPRST